MKSKIIHIVRQVLVLLAALFAFSSAATAQDSTNTTFKPVVSILLPLNLDSLFKGEEYKFGNTIPKFSLPFLEFYNGVQLAADSLRKEGIPATIQVLDSRKGGSLSRVLQSAEVGKSNLLIGLAQSGTELKMIADKAKAVDIPLISATYPNDGGIKDNGNLFVVNSTLKTHCNGIYKYLLANHAMDKLVLITRKGNIEPMLKNWLDEAATNSKSIKLNWQVVNLSDSFSTAQVQALLDSNRQNTILGATLDAEFSKRLVRSISSLQPTYRTTIMGMPTWDEIDLTKPEFKGVDVMFSTPFISLSANIDAYNALTKQYAAVQNSKPSDMAIKGFEVTYRFMKNLYRWKTTTAFTEHINDRESKVFCDFKFESVLDNATPQQVNYYENKKLYFIKKNSGLVKGIY